MFRIKGNITIGLMLVMLFVTSAAFVPRDTNKPFKGDIDTNPLKGDIDADVDSAESIKLRIGTGDPVAGREKSQLCQGCHGEYGISNELLIPKLAGQYGNYISKQINDYKAGTRTHKIMTAMAGTLSHDDLADIAAYFASQNKMKGDGSAYNQLGKELFFTSDSSKMRLACVNCHGVRGKGLEPKISMFPVIGGQHKDYIRRQLVMFRDGDRTNSPNGIMNRIASSLTDTEIEALAEYVSVQ